MAYTPPVIGTNDVIRVTYNMRLDGQQMMMVLHCEPLTIVISNYLDAMEDLTEELAATLTGGGFWNGIRAVQSDELHYTSIVAQRIWTQRDVAVTTAVATDGALSAPAAPPNVAMSVTKRTLLATRRGVGRIQIPGLTVGALEDGLWSAAVTTAVQAHLATVLPATLVTDGGNEWKWVLPQLGQPSGPYQHVTSVQAQRTVRTMHRRTVGLGI